MTKIILLVLAITFWMLSYICFKLDKGNYDRGDFIGSIAGMVFLFNGILAFILLIFGLLVKVFE